ncbi:MAG: KR domain-containing protein, partial [Candidatus Aminicenantes bacterium]
VKTNIGHLDQAAGVAGFIKTILALKHTIIPPSLNYETPNPRIDFIDSPFYVNTRAVEWKDHGFPLRAGVSSFGLGGTNCHLVLEEAPENNEQRTSYTHRRQDTYQLILLSAKTQTALDKATENLARHFKENPGIDLADASYTLHVGRRAFPYRRMTLCADIPEAIDNLSAPDSENVYTSFSAEEKRNVVFMFPGYGTHYENMGSELYRWEPVFRQEMDRCVEILKGLADDDIKKIPYPHDPVSKVSGGNGNPHLSLFVFEYALAKLLMTWGIEPHAMIGHGIGLYTTALLSGVFSLEDALELVVLWETWMQGMQGMQRAPILNRFEKKLKRITFNRPRIPFISALSGHWLTGEEASHPGYWLKHLQGTDRSTEGLTELLKEKNSIFVEVAPPGLLSTSIRQQAGKTTNQTVINLVKQPGENTGEAYYLLTQIGRLWLAGVEIDWCHFYPGEKEERRYRIPLPPYPFERQPYWIEGNSFQVEAGRLTDTSKSSKKPDIADWFYLPSWKRSPLLCPGHKKNYPKPGSCWLVFEDPCGLGSQLVQHLKRKGQEVIIVKSGSRFGRVSDHIYTLNPGKNTDYETLFKELHTMGKVPGNIVHTWSVTRDSGNEPDWKSAAAAQDLGFYSLIYLVQAIGKHHFETHFRIFAISNNMHQVTGEEKLCPAKATLLGAVKVIPQEYTNIKCSSIDIVPRQPGNWNDEQLLDQLMMEFQLENPEKVVAFRANYRWLPTFEPIRLENSENRQTRLREKGIYLITGGLGGIGLELAKYLAERVHARLILTSRSPFPPRQEWEKWRETHDEEDIVSKKISKLQELIEIGAEVLICKADVTNLEEMQEVITRAEHRFGRINGVIHAAGVPDGCVIPLRTREMNEGILAGKVTGTLVLDYVLRDFTIDFFILCSSLISILALFGQVGYCAANAFLDTFTYLKTSCDGIFTTTINWDMWKEVGMGVDAVAQLAENENIQGAQQVLLKNAMSNTEAIDVFSRILEYSMPQVIVSTSDLMLRMEVQNRVEISRAGQEFEIETFQGTLYPRPELSTEYVPPQTEFEKTFANILKKFFGYEQVGINDNLFEFGVTSLTIIRLNSLLRDELQKTIPIVMMFEYPTIASLGQYLQQEEKGEPLIDSKIEAEELEKEEELLYDSVGLLREEGE